MKTADNSKENHAYTQRTFLHLQNATEPVYKSQEVCINPTILDYYNQYLEQAERFKDLDTKTLKTQRSHLKKMEHLFDTPAIIVLDINSEGMLGLMEQMQQLFENWASEGKAHRSILDYQRFFVKVICHAREAQNAPSDVARKTLNNRLNRIRRPSSPQEAKPWSPEDEDIERLYKYANDIISGKVERPFARYNAKTGGWSRRMSIKKVKMIRAAITVEASMAGRTTEIRDIEKSWVKDGQIQRIVTKMREPKGVIAKIRPDLWRYVQDWLDVSNIDDEKLFPYAESTFSNNISAFMRQAGWKGRSLGLYSLRRWGLTRLQESGKSDHVIMAVSQHKSRDSMKAYLSDAAEQRLGDEGREELQNLLSELILTADRKGTDIQAMLEELKRVRNLFSADEANSIVQMKEEERLLGKVETDFIVERRVFNDNPYSVAEFSLNQDKLVDHSNETVPTLRLESSRFTQRIGNKLRSIRSLGPTIQNYGIGVSDGDKSFNSLVDVNSSQVETATGNAKDAGGRIRTCEPLRTGTSSQRR